MKTMKRAGKVHPNGAERPKGRTSWVCVRDPALPHASAGRPPRRPDPKPQSPPPEHSVRARQLVQDFDRRRPTGDSLKQQVTTGNGREAVFTGEGRGRLAVERPQEGRGALVGGVGSIAMAFRGSGVAYREHPRRTSVDHTPCQGI